MATQNDFRENNQQLISYLETPGMEKRGNDAINNFTRTTMREEGFFQHLMPQVQITNDELDRRIDSDLPWKVIDKEPGSPAAISLPFANLPSNYYIMAPRYAVQFDRVYSDRFVKDVDTLRTYVMDVRQVISDNAVKDMLAEEDSAFLSAVNTALGSINSVQPLAGTALYQSIAGSMGRIEVVEMLKIINRTPFRLESTKCLTNFVSWKNFMKWGRDEMGGDKAEQIIFSGMHEAHFLDRDWVVTIKRDLVPDETVYMFPAEKFIGKSFVLEDTTMFMKKEGPMLEWYFYKSRGASLGHVGFARADFV